MRKSKYSHRSRRFWRKTYKHRKSYYRRSFRRGSKWWKKHHKHSMSWWRRKLHWKSRWNHRAGALKSKLYKIRTRTYWRRTTKHTKSWWRRSFRMSSKSWKKTHKRSKKYWLGFPSARTRVPHAYTAIEKERGCSGTITDKTHKF